MNRDLPNSTKSRLILNALAKKVEKEKVLAAETLSTLGVYSGSKNSENSQNTNSPTPNVDQNPPGGHEGSTVIHEDQSN